MCPQKTPFTFTFHFQTGPGVPSGAERPQYIEWTPSFSGVHRQIGVAHYLSCWSTASSYNHGGSERPSCH